MSIEQVRRPRRRPWAYAVPIGVAAVVAAGAVALNVGSAGASPVLPAKSAQQLVTDVLASSTRALSGTLAETADLGLPSLPTAAGTASLNWQQFLTGTTTARVWIDGPDQQRFAVTGQLSEADIVHHGTDLWTYVSSANSYSHQTVPARDTAGTGMATPDASTPTAAAQRLLAALDPGTRITVSDNVEVAGRPAYTLVLAPQDAASTVGSVGIAVDAATSVPLRVQIFAAGASSPAISTGFTAVDFATPAASNFTFTPPAGATVDQHPFSGATSHHHGRGSSSAAAPAPTTGADATPTTVGTGWATVAVLPAGTVQQSLGTQLQQLTTPIGSSGARLLHTALVNAVVAADGRVFVGAVTPATLEQIAGSH